MIPADQSHLSVSAISHPGMSGKNNEDDYAVTSYQISHSNKTPSVLVVLADGVGGHNAGEIASKITTKTLTKIISESNAVTPLKTLENAIIQAGQEVARKAAENQEYRGMASTCACVWVIDNRLYTASVGDSRIYLTREHSIQQLTTDHTWVQEAIDHGIIKPEEAKDHPQAHVIRRYLGSQSKAIPDLRLRLREDETDEEAVGNQGMKLRSGDKILLCSDGLTDLVEEKEIFKILQNNPNEQAVNSLVALANNRGGHDNITIVTLEVPPHFKPGKHLTVIKGKLRKNRLRWFVLLVISSLIIVITALITWLFSQDFFGALDTQIPPSPTVSTEMTPLSTEEIENLSLTLTPTFDQTETPIRDTYTPWPTHTYPAEP